MKKIWLLLIAIVVINVVYWQDPWLWRRYVSTFGQLAGINPRLLTPNEVVSGDGSNKLQLATPDERVISTAALQDAQAYLAEFDSFAMLVAYRGVIQGEWYADGWDETSLTQSQSMHKSLQALFIGIALEQELINSIDDPVSRYVSEWQEDPRGAITLRQLLQMSSGLAQYDFSLNPFTDDYRWLYSGDSVAPLLRTPLADWAPGTKFDYNNLNSELLGVVLERATGKRYAELLQEWLWQPIGAGEARVWLDHENGRAHTSCCLMATARDWLRVGLMIMNHGKFNGHRIVSADWVNTMTAPSPAAEYYGLQLWRSKPDGYSANEGTLAQQEPFLATDMVFFVGRGGQFVFMIPSLELIIIRIGPALGPKPLKDGWDTARFVNTIVRGLQLPPPVIAAISN